MMLIMINIYQSFTIINDSYLSVTSVKEPCSRRHLINRTELINGTDVNSSTVRVTVNLYFFFFMIKVMINSKSERAQLSKLDNIKKKN